MKYIYDKYQLEIEGNRGTFYNNGNLQFMGDAYIAMKSFISHCDAPEVTRRFRAQLTMREECRFKNQIKEVKDGTRN
tara:strand:- start:186 stop:416 length:231 start_codon:yes stop_codon:yes gene_type:complete